MRLRVIDFGRVAPLHSQTLWHAVAFGVSAGAPPTLCFMEPDGPYVSIGLHRSPDELDPVVCGPDGLPVFRRMVGGGPVYIDRGQLFFQIVVPRAMAATRRRDTLRRLLVPAVAAFRDVGIDARLDDHGEIVVGDRKICGHAGGQIEEAVVVVGNVIDAFDHAAAASIVQVPAPEVRDEFRHQMRRFVSPTPCEFGAFVAAATRRYAEALGLDPTPGTLEPLEEEELERLDRLFVDPDWVRGPRPRPRHPWSVKVKAGVWVGHTQMNGHRVTAAFEEGGVRSVRIWSEGREVAAVVAEDRALPVSEALARLDRVDGTVAELVEKMAANPPM